MAEGDGAHSGGSAKRGRTKRRKPRRAPKIKPRPVHARKAMPKPASEPTATRAAKLAVNIVEFEKTTFDSAVKLFSTLNDRSEKVLRNTLSNASWMPKEGHKLVEEWQHTLRRSLKDFTKTVDKSFDLLSRYLARVRADSAKERK